MKYDLHVHTKYSVKCGYMEPAELLKVTKKRGLNGIAVCDHNTIEGALLAKKLNKDKNFEVIVLGASSEVVTPLPIPNRAVKDFSADGSSPEQE